MECKCWPFAFHTHLLVHNASQQNDGDESPQEIAMGVQPDLFIVQDKLEAILI